MSTEVAFLPRQSEPPTAAAITKALLRFEGAFVDVTAAFTRSAEQMQFLGEQAYQAAQSFSIQFTMTKQEHRRMLRNMARLNRQPALIHKGRKPR